MSVLFLAGAPNAPTARTRVVTEGARFLLDRDVEVTLLTSCESLWWTHGLDKRVRVVSLEGKKYHAVWHEQQGVVFRWTQSCLTLLRRATRRAARVWGVSRPARVAARSVAGLEQWQVNVTHILHKAYESTYFRSRGWTLWRAAGRVRALVDLHKVDHVVVANMEAMPLAWHFAQRYPQVEVRFALDRARFLCPRTNLLPRAMEL